MFSAAVLEIEDARVADALGVLPRKARVGHAVRGRTMDLPRFQNVELEYFLRRPRCK